jgi:hypothetical protein
MTSDTGVETLTAWERHEARLCALRSLASLWLTCWLVSLLQADGAFRSPSINLSWLPFVLMGLTMVWVVVAEVAPFPLVAAVYIAWGLCLVATTVWVASTEPLGEATVRWTGVLAMTFTLLALLLPSTRTLAPTLVAAVAAAAVAMASARFLAPQDSGGSRAQVAGGLAGAMAVFTTASIWIYATTPRTPRQRQYACMFAAMSPWTYAVDSFEWFVRPVDRFSGSE